MEKKLVQVNFFEDDVKILTQALKIISSNRANFIRGATLIEARKIIRQNEEAIS